MTWRHDRYDMVTKDLVIQHLACRCYSTRHAHIGMCYSTRQACARAQLAITSSDYPLRPPADPPPPPAAGPPPPPARASRSRPRRPADPTDPPPGRPFPTAPPTSQQAEFEQRRRSNTYMCTCAACPVAGNSTNLNHNHVKQYSSSRRQNLQIVKVTDGC